MKIETLNIWTIIFASVVIVISFFIIKKDKLARWATIVIGTLLITFSLIFSYNALYVDVKSVQDFFKFINPQVMFIVVLFIAVLFSFWILMLSVGIFNRERISEFGAKIFGIEINNKFTDKELTENKQNADNLKAQIAIINTLSTEIEEFLGTDFESTILEYPSDQRLDIIRKMVSGVFYKTYNDYYPEVKVLVTSLLNITSLPDPISSIVYSYLPYVKSNFTTTTKNKKIGLGIHLVDEEDLDLSTIIIIDASQIDDYQVTLAEICLAGNLFMSLSTIIDWAEEVEKAKKG